MTTKAGPALTAKPSAAAYGGEGMMEKRERNRVFNGLPIHGLAGARVLLALIVASLCLVGWTSPMLGRAAAGPPAQTRDSAKALAPTDLVSHTVFLPYVHYEPPPADNVWRTEYYSNATLNGEPVRTSEEVRIDYDWEDGAPQGLPTNYFSIRWTGEWDFEIGKYTFFLDADDGVRLWLDDVLLIDGWTNTPHSETYTLVIDREGAHRLKVEYYEWTQLAYVRLHWRRTDLYPRWRGAYYRLPWAESGKTYEQVDDAIQFDWGNDCPEGLPCDGFSVLWRAEPVFLAGTQRIYLYADDGYQLYLDDAKVKEGGWLDGQLGGGEDAYYDLDLSQVEQHEITYVFHDRGGLAEARLWIQDLEQPEWKVEYYDNRFLSGNPSATKTDPVVFYDWKWGKPKGSNVYSDNFSVRWSGQRYFPAGCYRFGLFVDDGVLLYVDGELLVDEWQDGRAEYYAPATYLSTGYHEVVIEYYEHDGEAEIRFWW
jgi:hypothetical protein